jgi:hypothetical protein
MRAVLRTAVAVVVLALSSAVAMADDWVAVRLRSVVLQLVDGAWEKLARGDIVPDSRVIRTLGNGNVEFERGEERVALGTNTQIQIYDEVRRRPFTTVKHYFGTVTVEAEVQDVQHFAVQTQYLAAVVKGTRFTVTAGEHGAKVAVERGSVFVQDRATRNDVTIEAGQSATVDGSTTTPKVSTSGGASFVLLPPGRLKKSDDTSDDKLKKAKSGDDEKTNNGKSGDDDDKSKNGKSDDEKSNNGKSDEDKADKGKSDEDQSSKGKSDDDDDDDD